ncbi:ATP-dependent helicase [Veillonella sp. AS16]|uniref:UvrD-helicase domain-containing protein n=1 Tax=Veillonella sp. AS16 TaxID=936589 RepID=UPI0003E2620D|nr:ATP-dependent helicase [Veillonella sp. AS16]ETS93187.1 AAA protein [Veillonella sp. AS16]
MNNHKWTEEQKEIIIDKNTLIVSASAGTGKTFVITQKIEYEIQLNRSFKKLAALTFTNKAADELNSRLKKNNDGNFIGTIHNFVLHEIINPFFKDLYDLKYEGEVSYGTTLKFHTIKDGINKLSELGQVGNYYDNKKSFIFELALSIIKSSEACQLFLKSKYYKIFIDEYQDCDVSMHNLFLYILENFDIPLIIVGDEKQSIYSWRGADPTLFQSLLTSDKFEKYRLSTNFRSDASIQNYANLIFGYRVNSYKEAESNKVLFLVADKSNNVILNVLDYIDNKASLAILTRKNDIVKKIGSILNENGKKCAIIQKSPIENIQNKDSNIYLSIAKYIIIKGYSEYDFSRDVDLENKFKEVSLEELKMHLNKFNEIVDKSYKDVVCSIVKLFKLDFNEVLYSMLEETINNNIFHYGFNIDQYQNVVMTIHAAKGLEYEQIILFADDFDFTSPENRELHYVASTRAKSKLIIIAYNDWNSYKFWTYLKSRAEIEGVELDKIIKRVNLNLKR